MIALLAGQLAFVIYAGGDWMGCWRFIAPVIPLLAVLIPLSVAPLLRANPWVWGALLGTLGWGFHTQYLDFLVRPTTPHAVVAQIAKEFEAVADDLHLTDPTLAHHDAGGTSFRSRLRLLDLAGLGNREIAKHLKDATFLRNYILEQQRPDFIFGTTETFAARTSQFFQDPRFTEQYVPLMFQDRPYMVGGLCHVRRDRLNTDTPRLVLEREEGKILRVLVRPAASD